MDIDFYLIIKAIHIIFMVSYFAGIFYIVRLFIYQTDAKGGEHAEVLTQQYLFMEKRLWNIIIIPAGLIMALSGLTLLFNNGSLIYTAWMEVKLFFVFILLLYHIWCWRTLKQLSSGIYPYTSIQLRMANEVATLILFVVVFAVVLKNLFITYWYWVVITFILLGILIMLMVKLVNRKEK